MKQRIFLYAEEGKIVTPDGKYIDQILLAEGVSADGFRGISEEEYQRILAETALPESAEIYGNTDNDHTIM